MGADEEGTHERLRAHFAELVHPEIAEHRGRTVRTLGTASSLSSPASSMPCGARSRCSAGWSSASWRRPRSGASGSASASIFGDVIAERDDIFGDGVNVAARLEALADPGGVWISRTVREQIRDKLPYPFEDRGEQSVKNIARPVRVYALRPDALADLPAPSIRFPPPIIPPPAAPRLSIVVLPFANLSDDREQQYFADGITEDLTSDLSRLANMFVISRNTAFTYRNKPVDTRQIGRELGVRYVLEGSVRRSGSQVGVNAQLIDAATDTHCGRSGSTATRRSIAIQNEITSCLANALGVELIAAEAARPTGHPDALEYILQGRAVGV